MNGISYHFNDLTLLITHYNRSRSLERLLQSFHQLNCRFESIIVSDDCSKPEHIEYIEKIQQQYSFQLITTPKNKGLSNNINKGQDAVTTAYTLYVQEDFDPTPTFPKNLQTAFEIMQERKDLDMVRFYAYFKYPNVLPYKKGFSEMKFNIWKPGYKKFYQYSDHPHLRRSNFLQKFGRYIEGIKSDKAEYLMMLSFLKKKGVGLFFEEFQQLFIQKNSAEEPSTVKRNYLSSAQNTFIDAVRVFYRNIKLNINYLFR
jgi:glycosyltransferase involved in cell wall biosynthesis